MSRDLFISMDFSASDVRGINVSSIHDRGARDYQEDNLGFSSAEKESLEKYGFTAVVADGMGGLSDGAQISSYVVDSVLEMQQKRDPSFPVHIHFSKAFRAINNNIMKNGIKGGSTAAAVMCLPSGVHWCAIGDSRIYLFRNDFLTHLNEDSDYLNRLIERVILHEIAYAEAAKDPKKDALAQYMGYKEEITPDVNIRPLVPRKNDKLLICSDGVYNAASSEELSEALAHPAGEAAEIIKKTVLSKGYSNQDNFTAAVLEFV